MQPAARKQTVEDVDVAGKRVLVRVDFNVPMAPETTRISDDSRIRESLPTIRYLRERQARVILCCHFGRPKGRVVEEMRLAPVRKRLGELLELDVLDAAGPGGGEPASRTMGMGPGDVALLENLRFDRREEANDDGFARELASLADIYINDAFGTAHRAHASTVGVAQHLPAVAGMLMARELEMLGAAIASPLSPVVAIVGGAKVSDKIAVLENLARNVDRVLIGGGMVAAFARAFGHSGGAGDSTPEDVAAARALLGDSPAEILVPPDVVTGRAFAPDTPAVVRKLDDIPDSELILDIGPEACGAFADAISDARTIIWNGPPGVFEWEAFSGGTKAVANAVASNESATSIVGGGSTAEAVRAFGVDHLISHVSTGGGASLEFLEGKTLPGVAALLDK
ncbi:MAG: phosphoglycerate kinase [Chloroflexi bacterium]|nr:phosphoglycerate kinase [Chloroflexota bacterium]